MINTGLRISEASNLKVGDLLISVRKGSATVRGGQWEKFRKWRPGW
jgi:hypothetical protein